VSQGRVENRFVVPAVVVDPTADVAVEHPGQVVQRLVAALVKRPASDRLSDRLCIIPLDLRVDELVTRRQLTGDRRLSDAPAECDARGRDALPLAARDLLRLFPNLWTTKKAAERWTAKNPPEAYRDMIRVWGVFTDYRHSGRHGRWSKALVRHGADARVALAKGARGVRRGHSSERPPGVGPRGAAPRLVTLRSPMPSRMQTVLSPRRAVQSARSVPAEAVATLAGHIRRLVQPRGKRQSSQDARSSPNLMETSR
jgi:hypothetical protein